MDARPAVNADAALFAELMEAVIASDHVQPDHHASLDILGLPGAFKPPESDRDESDGLLCEDVEMFDELYAHVVALDDNLFAYELEGADKRSGLEEQEDKSVEGSVGRSDGHLTRQGKRSRTGMAAPKKYNPNKAREEQRRELLSLRCQVSDMTVMIEKLKTAAAAAACGPPTLQVLKSRRHQLVHSQPSLKVANDKGTLKLADIWRQMCLQQLSRRIKAEQENARLKGAVARGLQVTCGIQALLQTPFTSNDGQDALTCKLLKPHNVVSTKVKHNIFARLSSGIEAAIGKIDKFLEDKGLENADTPQHGTQVRDADGGIELDLFVTSVLPFEWEVASSGIWRFYNGSQKHFGRVHDKETQRIDSGDGVVMESFVIEITAGTITADFRVHQVFKRFIYKQQQVLVCQNDCHPIAYANQPTNFGFRETSFVISRPPRAHSLTGKLSGPATVLQLGQWMSPYMTTTNQSEHLLCLRSNINDISRFLFSSLLAGMRAKIDRIGGLLFDEHYGCVLNCVDCTL